MEIALSWQACWLGEAALSADPSQHAGGHRATLDGVGLLHPLRSPGKNLEGAAVASEVILNAVSHLLGHRSVFGVRPL